jgi:peptide/nickel transport system substrate-binding protein
VLQGNDAVQFDTPAQSIVKLAYESYPAQITFTQGSGDHYVALNNSAGVFKNVNLRRAAWANLDRAAIIKLKGGSLTGSPATHFIYPGVSGYEQSGGAAGPQVEWNKSVTGNLQVAEKYMKAAGYPSGKYTGSAVVQIVGANNGNDPAIIQLLNTDLTQLGFKTHVSLVDQSVMYAKYCGVPKQEIDACPTVGWVRDFADPLTVLYVPFYGPAITPTNNSNWGQVNDPAINTAMQQAALVTDPTARAQAWANVDKMLVNQAVAIPEDFDNQANVRQTSLASTCSGRYLGPDFTSLRTRRKQSDPPAPARLAAFRLFVVRPLFASNTAPRSWALTSFAASSGGSSWSSWSARSHSSSSTCFRRPIPRSCAPAATPARRSSPTSGMSLAWTGPWLSSSGST